MSGKVLGELGPRPCRVDRLLIGHGHDPNPLGPLQKRKRIRNGPRSRAAEVPGQRYGIERGCRLASRRLGQDQGWAARAKDDRLGIPLLDIVAVSDRNDREIVKTRMLD